MKKRVFEKILIIFLLSTIFIIAISMNNPSFALGDVTNDISWTSWQPTVEEDNKFLSKTGIILGVIQVVGVVVSVVSLAYIGIKFMTGSVEEKASYKQRIVPWIFGATMVFAITTIPSLIYNITQNSVVKITEKENGDDSHLIGAADAVDWALKTWNQISNEIGDEGKGEESQKEIRFKTKLEQQYKGVTGKDSYWNGYRTVLMQAVEKTNPYAYIWAYNDIDSLIESGEISKDNIAEKYKAKRKERQSYEENGIYALSSHYDGEIYRLMEQLIYWGMTSEL